MRVSTEDPALRSWVSAANEAGTDFPIQNLPYGVFRDDHAQCVCIGVAIGESVLDLHAVADEGLLTGLPSEIAKACRQETLHPLMGLGPVRAKELRQRLSNLLRADAEASTQVRIAPHLYPQEEVTMLLPAVIGDYTDFYASIDHAMRVGRLFRPEQPLLPNYKHVPIGYHGRASSIVVSGETIYRPTGQILKGQAPVFAPTQMLDYEVELGVFTGVGNERGRPVAVADASDHIFGFCLVNDWSARDIQAWEYQPLGPFLSKSFATSVSPWIVTLDALEPFRVPARRRAEEDPAFLPYLTNEADQHRGGLDIQLEVLLQTATMRGQGQPPALLSRSNTRELYWTIAQMLTHHASNGCNLRTADLYATGTVSGTSDEARGCLLELTERGAKPITLPNGETRSFLEDGDEIILRGYCEREGAISIGFGECRGLILRSR